MDTVDYVKQNEGLRLKPYKCSAGKLTIGYGRNLEDVGIDEFEAELLLSRDIRDAENDCFSLFDDFAKLSSDRRTVLIDMMFNLGLNRLSKFKKMIKAINEKKFMLAADEMLDSLYAQQVPNRANKNAELMRRG